jgi:hypothetical protein
VLVGRQGWYWVVQGQDCFFLALNSVAVCKWQSQARLLGTQRGFVNRSAACLVSLPLGLPVCLTQLRAHITGRDDGGMCVCMEGDSFVMQELFEFAVHWVMNGFFKYVSRYRPCM